MIKKDVKDHIKNYIKMKQLKVKTRIILYIILILPLSSCNVQADEMQDNASSGINMNREDSRGCTVFTISKGDKVLFGGNDDYINPDSYYWVDPGDSTKYGVIWIGTPDNVQQGVNEKGLAYDANGLPRVDVNPHNERTPVTGGYSVYPIRIMHECATVMEVIDWINTHQWHSYMHDQMQFADASGDAVIISAGKDGEVVFTRKTPGDGFIVSTNFNVANPENGFSYPCWRYDKARELLGQLLEGQDAITTNDATNVLEAVHMEGASWTIESMAADLTSGIVYLYFYHQFDKPVVLNVKDELSNPREAGPLSMLFPEDVRLEAAKRYRHYTSIERRNRVVGITWSGLLIISLFLLIILPGKKKNLIFWIPAVIVLGPIALLVKFLTLNSGKISVCREALLETTGDIFPVVIAFLVSQVILILKMVAGGISQELQLLLIFAVPLLSAWIIFHGPFLASAGKKNYIKVLFKRFPQVLITTFLGLAGILPVSLPLENKSLAMTQIIPLSPWIVMTWWAIFVLGSLAGGLLVFIYEHWAVKRGYRAWSIIAGNEGEVDTPKLNKIWWWIILSFIITLAMLVATVILLKTISG
jgi:hypothetical protein